MFERYITRIKEFYYKYLSWINKYVLVTLGVIILMNLDYDYSFVKRYKNDAKIRQLQREIKFYQKKIVEDRKKLDELQTDKDGLERFAREKYFMKHADEDVFIIDEN